MLVATALVLALTTAAPVLGARLAGLLATFPVFAAVLAVFAHRVEGQQAAQSVLRGLLLGLFAFSGFFVVIALAIERTGITAAFVLASLVAGLIQAFTLWLVRGSPASGRCRTDCD